MTLVLHAWLTCQMQVSKAQSDWFSLSLSHWLSGLISGCGCSQAQLGQPDLYRDVCTDIYLDGNRVNARLRRERKCRAGKEKWRLDEMSGYWQAVWLDHWRTIQHACRHRHMHMQTHIQQQKKKPWNACLLTCWITGKSIHADMQADTLTCTCRVCKHINTEKQAQRNTPEESM